MLKTCGNCLTEKDSSLFATKNKTTGQLQSYCKDCQKIYRKKHYEENKDYYKDKSKKWTRTKKENFFKWVNTQSCVDCGISDIRVLEFDHVRGIKVGGIAQLLQSASKERFEAELAKCEVVCSNCHKIRTAKRTGWYKNYNL